MDFCSLQKQDVDAVVSLAEDIMPHAWSAQHFLQSLLANDICWVLRLQKTLVGFIIAKIVLNQCEILNLGVAKKYQQQGCGKALLHRLLDYCQQQQIETIFLEVRASNQAAISLYQQLGFVETGRRVGYYPGIKQNEDAVLMRRSL